MLLPVPNGNFYRLVILEQVPNQRACWQEEGQTPVRVAPLLLNFNFEGACDRKTDSNGYSIRVNGRDLGLDYRLDISRRQDELVLFASPVRDRSAPTIEIGRTGGIADGSLKIQLNPGWRMAYRTYNGQTLGHIYLTHDAPLDVQLAAGNNQTLASVIDAPPAGFANAFPPGNPSGPAHSNHSSRQFQPESFRGLLSGDCADYRIEYPGPGATGRSGGHFGPR